MECGCNSNFKIQKELMEENVEELLRKTLFGCLKAWLIFIIRKIGSCFEGKREATTEETDKGVDDGGGSLYTTQKSE